ncbi:MAG: hypothetical protein M3304_03720 [Actinomycetota bacterium]|nr:hypothetical protein [Actinomycetota bacterium]
MTPLEPQLAVIFASMMMLAAAKVRVGRGATMLDEPEAERCAACGRDLSAGRPCGCSE